MLLVSAVHPRPRGEHMAAFPALMLRIGSSPPTRGTRDGTGGDEMKRRFIPAHAGNTSWWTGTRGFPSVHPRPRGEHSGALPSRDTASGSSPPTRGTQRPVHLRAGKRRFIPAHAGNTSRAWSFILPPAVHPRPRGEHPGEIGLIRPFAGSSPPTRGTHVQGRSSADASRFIPAHAGNTSTCDSSLSPFPVHPRPRGEHIKACNLV